MADINLDPLPTPGIPATGKTAHRLNTVWFRLSSARDFGKDTYTLVNLRTHVFPTLLFLQS